MLRSALRLSLLLAVVFGASCGSSTPPAPPTDERPPGGEKVGVTMPPAPSAELEALRQSLGEVSQLTADTFADRYALQYGPALGYDPLASSGMDRILASAVPPSAAEQEALARHGFVISADRTFPTFTYGYATLYSQHLPLYVSADSILDAVHRSYDNILKELEQGVLGPELQALLESLRATLVSKGARDAGVARDVDFYLTTALGLLTGSAAPVAGASSSDVAAFVADATAAKGVKDVVLFGVQRQVDFSQFTPRGHYTFSEPLKRYFRAMMWMGRIDFRLIETLPSGDQVFYRRQFDAMLALNALFDAANLARHRAIDEVIQTFVGESDNMKVAEVARLLADLGAPADATSVDAPDQRVAQTILDGGYGAQRIATDIMVNDAKKPGPLPLHRTFLVFGQRYALDSHVFSNVVFDRVPRRMMPSPLDAAFAALRNDQAGVMLDAELRAFPYAPNLAKMRILAEAHGPEYWDANLYTLWLSSLRALSPTPATSDPASLGMPFVTGTEPWQRRLLNTQLASWSELRHDTILYVKQSYTSGDVCEFPDAYVDPYPEFFSAFERFADHAMQQVVPIAQRSSIDPRLATSLAAYFERLGKTASMLRQMAESERTGMPFTPEMMAFINQTVTVQQSCGGAVADGWYPKLVFGESTKFDPTIADVHTQPTDEGGNPVGRVLHVGTGYSRLMVVTTNGCTGPRAYAGLAFSYYEKTTENFDRLTDERWSAEVRARTPVDVPWMRDLLGR